MTQTIDTLYKSHENINLSNQIQWEKQIPTTKTMNNLLTTNVYQEKILKQKQCIFYIGINSYVYTDVIYTKMNVVFIKLLSTAIQSYTHCKIAILIV